MPLLTYIEFMIGRNLTYGEIKDIKLLSESFAEERIKAYFWTDPPLNEIGKEILNYIESDKAYMAQRAKVDAILGRINGN